MSPGSDTAAHPSRWDPPVGGGSAEGDVVHWGLPGAAQTLVRSADDPCGVAPAVLRASPGAYRSAHAATSPADPTGTFPRPFHVFLTPNHALTVQAMKAGAATLDFSAAIFERPDVNCPSPPPSTTHPSAPCVLRCSSHQAVLFDTGDSELGPGMRGGRVMFHPGAASGKTASSLVLPPILCSLCWFIW